MIASKAYDPDVTAFAHSPTVMVTTRLPHPIHELSRTGNLNLHLALGRYCATHGLRTVLEYICERRGPAGLYIQYWAPIETPTDPDA